MLFNSFEFLVFFTIFFVLFFYTKGHTRHAILFVSSCIFYAWFIPKYLLILFLAIGIDYYAAIKIEDATTEAKRKIGLLFGVINTCALLFVFKYYNFFIENVSQVLGSDFVRWDIILPIGLSFHTFQSLSYVIDVYRKKVKPERNLLIYSNYVMMFPQLVAGPIERAGHLMPQLRESLTYRLNQTDFVIGASLFFYGLFKKVVVADNIAPYVDSVYSNHALHDGSTLLLASMLFSVQIYADFSGYSDMAIGLARMLGFSFQPNFATPYFSRSVTEFWRRWHISLSSWIRDYLYYPLVRSFGRTTKVKIYLSTLITFALIGLWHGANWTFLAFGTLHGIYLVAEGVTEKTRKSVADFLRLEKLGFIYYGFQTSVVFILVSLSFVFFRSTSFEEALSIFKNIFFDFPLSKINVLDTNGFAVLFFSIGLLFLSEFFVFRKFTVEDVYKKEHGTLYSMALIAISLLLILAFGFFGGGSFIYFQF